MTDPFVTQLDNIRTHATSATDFLKKVGPLHVKWHQEFNSGTNSIGFLLFHWEFIQRFNAVGGPAHFGGITPFTTADFTTWGQPYNVGVTVRNGNLGDFENFSADMDAWHNNAHMAVGMHFHVNLMAPKTNVRLVQFWQLHYFINDRFEQQLANFGAGTPASIVAALEAGAGLSLI